MSQKIVPLFAVLAALASLPASAQDCDALVVDGARVLNGRILEVAQAADRLKEATGADLRVRILASHPNLPAAIGEMRAQCASWLDANGGRCGNLLVLAFAMGERKSELDFGGDWTTAIGGQWPNIQNAVVTPRFRSGDIAGGIVAGIASVQQRIAAYQAPPAPAREAPAPVVVHTEPSKPMDLSWLQSVFFVLLGLLAAVAALFGLKQLARELEKRKVHRELAINAKRYADDRLLEVKSQGLEASAAYSELVPDVDFIESQPVREALDKADAAFSGAVGEFNTLAGGINDPNIRWQPIARYDRIAQLYNGVKLKFEKASNAYRDTQKLVVAVRDAIRVAPEAIQEAKRALASADAAIGALSSQGYRFDDCLAELKQQAVPRMDLAEVCLAQRQYGKAARLARESKERSSSIAESADNRVKRALALAARADSLQEAVETLRLKGVEARKVFDLLKEEFSPESWESVKGNGTEAANRFTLATESIGAARGKLDLSVQDWAGAAELLDKAAKAVERAGSYLHSIFVMSAALSNAKADALPDVERAEEALAKSEAANKEYDADVEDAVWPSIKEAKGQLHDARNLLQHSKPNYFRVIKLARAALKTAGETLEAANAQHEAAEVKRTRAANALRDAKSRVATAKEYIDDRRSKVKAKNKKKLEDAEDALKRAEASGDTDFIIVTAESSEATAKGAYEGARSDVSNADSASWSSPSSGGGSSGSSWGSSWDSGGSSSGSFDFGGGGGSDGGSW